MARLPTVEECFNILNDNQVPFHIIEHSITVARVGLTLAMALKESRPLHEGLDIELVAVACLLHDVKKMECIEHGCDHAEAGSDYLNALGLPDVASLVRQHYRLDPENKDFSRIKEVHLLYYADNRVKHHEIVDIDERFEDLIERYGRDKRTIRDLRMRLEETKELEKRLFSVLTFGPDALKEEVLNGESDHFLGPLGLSHRDLAKKEHLNRSVARQSTGT